MSTGGRRRPPRSPPAPGGGPGRRPGGARPLRGWGVFDKSRTRCSDKFDAPLNTRLTI